MHVTVLVDFVLLTRHGVVPHASVVVHEGRDDPGFYSSCKTECKVTTDSMEDGTTFPRMAFCGCVARLLAEDLAADFAELGSALGFALGEIRRVEAPDLFSPADGHDALYSLMRDPPAGAERTPGRVTVWVADALPAGGSSVLEGSTFLSQVLAKDKPGAGVILVGSVPRGGRRLSHEVGHVVGFHHTAGEGLDFDYTSKLCGVDWPVLQHPTCEINIMGGWYDGPYCCPSPGAEQPGCKPLGEGPWGAYCCGEQCTHRCPADRPAMTFATPEHAGVMRELATCWAEHVNSTDVQPYAFSLLSADAYYVEDPPRPDPPWRKRQMLRRVRVF